MLAALYKQPFAPVPALSMSVSRVTGERDLAALAEDWNALAGDIPFRRWEWLASWWHHFRTPYDELYVLTVHTEGGALLGIAPWYLRATAQRGRIIRFLGSGEAYSDYLTVLAVPGLERHVVERVAAFLLEHARDWDTLVLERVDCADTLLEALSQVLHNGHCRLLKQPTASCWRVELPQAWDDYLAQLSKKRRYKIRSLVREKFASGAAQLRWVQGAQELNYGLSLLAELHQRRRASLNEANVFAIPQFAGFINDAAERFLSAGRLRLHWIELDGKPVAAALDLIGGDTVYCYQTGMEPAAGEEQPGWLRTIAALRWALEDGYRCYDFLGGNEAYKAYCRAQEQPQQELRIVAPHARACARYRLWLAWRWLKGLVKKTAQGL